MRITFLLPRLNLSGGSRVVASYAQRLQARGHQVTVVARPFAQPTRYERLRTLIKHRRRLRQQSTC